MKKSICGFIGEFRDAIIILATDFESMKIRRAICFLIFIDETEVRNMVIALLNFLQNPPKLLFHSPEHVLSNRYNIPGSHGDKKIMSFELGEEEIFDLGKGREVMDIGSGFF